MQNVGAVL